MTDAFDPLIHKIVAIDTEGHHIHATLGEIKADLANVQATRRSSPDTTAELEALLNSIPVPADVTARVEKLETLLLDQERVIQALVQKLNDIAALADKKLTDLEVTQSFIIRNALAKVELTSGAA